MLHSVGAVTFFGGFILFSLLDLAGSTGTPWAETPHRSLAVVAAAALAACKLAQFAICLKHHLCTHHDAAHAAHPHDAGLAPLRSGRVEGGRGLLATLVELAPQSLGATSEAPPTAAAPPGMPANLRGWMAVLEW